VYMRQRDEDKQSTSERMRVGTIVCMCVRVGTIVCMCVRVHVRIGVYANVRV